MKYDKQWKILFLVCSSTFVYTAVFQSIPPILRLLITEFTLSHTQVGILMSIFAFPGILFSLPGGVFTDYYGPRRVGIVSLILMILGILIVATGTNFISILIGRFITGIGATAIFIVSAQALSHSFRDRQLGIAMGIFSTSLPIGVIFAHNVFNVIGEYWNWRAPIIFSGVLCAFVLVLFVKCSEFPEVENKEKINILIFFTKVKENKFIWLLAFSWMAFSAARVSSLTFAPDYFINIGFTIHYSGFLTSLFTMGSLIIAPLMGLLIYKFGKYEHFLIIGGVAFALFLLLIPFNISNPLILSISIGLAAALIPVSTFSFVPKLISSEELGRGYGILRVSENTGYLLGPFFVGLTYDQTGNYFFCFLLMAIFALSTALIALILYIMVPK